MQPVLVVDQDAIVEVREGSKGVGGDMVGEMATIAAAGTLVIAVETFC